MWTNNASYKLTTLADHLNIIWNVALVTFFYRGYDICYLKYDLCYLEYTLCYTLSSLAYTLLPCLHCCRYPEVEQPPIIIASPMWRIRDIL